ncbi:TPA: M14 family metallopeptidase [Pseudomonas aeruginosa]
MERIDHLLPWSTLGSEKRLSVFRFGCGARKVYIQSSLHADELPGMRTAWELKQRLRLLEAEGRLRGTVELVPVANTVGLGQMIQALHQGRFEMSSGRNFNRDFPDLLDAVIDSVGERLGSDPAANVALVRQALRAALDALPPATSELEGMQRLLYRHACDADLVLDLHCDFEAAIHLYTLPQQWPAFASLAARLGAAVGLLAEESGGGSFDEACSVPWLRLSRLYPRAELPLACLATTVELGGQADTTVQQAEANAAAILAFLAEQGFVEGEWPAAPEACCEGLPFEGTEYVHAPHTGVVSFLRRPGEWVEAGEPLFQVIDPLADRASTVCAGVSGVLFAIERMRYAQPGLWLAKVAGRQPIRQGRLLSD